MICNEKGRNLDLPYNRPLMDESGLPYDIVCGTFFMAGVSGEHLVSLTEEQIQRYKDLYDNVMIVTAVKEQPPQEMPAEKKKKPKSKGER